MCDQLTGEFKKGNRVRNGDRGKGRDRDGDDRDGGEEHTYLSNLGVHYFSQVIG